MAMICFLCRSSNNEMEAVEHCLMTSSKKPAKILLIHLGNLIKTKLKVQSDASLCRNCVQDLRNFDNLMFKLLAAQEKLTQQLRQALSDYTPQINNENTYSISNNIAGDGFEKESESIENRQEVLSNGTPMDVTTTDATVLTENSASSTVLQGFMSDESADSWETVQHEEITNQTAASTIKLSLWPEQQCDSCGRKFKSKRQLQRHEDEVHKNIYQCSICGVTRRSRDYLLLHMNIHEGKTELECRYCDKTFVHLKGTVDHMQKHWNRMEYQCETCGQMFAQDSLLRSHLSIHKAEENPLVCQHCNFRCRTQKTYKNHLKTHSSDRPRYHCPRCPKSFTERYTLKTHMQRHGESLPPLPTRRKASQPTQGLKREDADSLCVATELPKASIIEEKETLDYACTICATRFSTRSLLNKHLESIHDVIIN